MKRNSDNLIAQNLHFSQLGFCPPKLYIEARHGSINHDFTMMQFEKVKMALSKVTKVLKAGIDLIVLLTNIVLAGLIIWLLIDETTRRWQNSSVSITSKSTIR